MNGVGEMKNKEKKGKRSRDRHMKVDLDGHEDATRMMLLVFACDMIYALFIIPTRIIRERERERN